MVSVRGLYRFLTGENLVQGNPVKQVSLPKTGLALPRIITVPEVSSLLEAPDTRTPRGPPGCGDDGNHVWGRAPGIGADRTPAPGCES